jgi:hypothetical protein
MARRKLAKTLVFSLLWAIFLSLLITNWDALKSVRWQDLGETLKISSIVDIIKWNVGYFLMFSLTILFMALYVRHIRKRQFANNDYDDEEEIRRRDRLHSPAYSSLGGNIHYGSDNYTTDKAFEDK